MAKKQKKERYFLITHYVRPTVPGQSVVDTVMSVIVKSETVLDENGNDMTERDVVEHFDYKPIIYMKELDK